MIRPLGTHAYHHYVADIPGRIAALLVQQGGRVNRPNYELTLYLSRC
jgi:hypothetical protein